MNERNVIALKNKIIYLIVTPSISQLFSFVKVVRRTIYSCFSLSPLLIPLLCECVEGMNQTTLFQNLFKVINV